MFDLEKKKKKKDRLLKFFNDQYCVLILHSFSKEKKKKKFPSILAFNTIKSKIRNMNS